MDDITFCNMKNRIDYSSKDCMGLVGFNQQPLGPRIVLWCLGLGRWPDSEGESEQLKSLTIKEMI
jgi:hypothetical protein